MWKTDMKTGTNTPIIIQDNFLSVEECNKLIEFYKSQPTPEKYYTSYPILLIPKEHKSLTEKITKFSMKVNNSMIDYFHIVSGDGYLAIMEMIPQNKTAHLYLHEPHRGYHEDSLHRKLNGKLKRPSMITNLILSKGRKNDLSIVRRFANNPKFFVSGNSSYSAQRSRDVYNIECDLLHPCVDQEEYPSEVDDIINPITQTTQSEYVVTVGTANWAKATMETISMLSGTGISLAHVGGGTDAEKSQLQVHAKNNSVELWIAPKLSSSELAKLMYDALAIVSMAHKEPFGLTPIEAFSIGTPAIFVDEGGFRDTIVDGKCGRLIARDNITEWHLALVQARDPENRKNWSKFGRDRILELKLSPKQQAEKIHHILQSI